MKITVYFLNGAVEEYNTETHYSSAGLFGSANVGVVDYTLMTEDLSEGLWLKFRYFDAGMAKEVQGVDGLGAPLMEGVMYPIIARSRLDDVAFVECDDKRILWRTGPGEPFVNGIKFMTQSKVYVDSKDDYSDIARSVDLYRQLHGDFGKALLPQRPGETEAEWNERIAERIGWDTRMLLYYVSAYSSGQAAAGASDQRRISEVQSDFAEFGEMDAVAEPEFDFASGEDASSYDTGYAFGEDEGEDEDEDELYI